MQGNAIQTQTLNHLIGDDPKETPSTTTTESIFAIVLYLFLVDYHLHTAV
jgi:hypothetical protein